MENEKIVSKNEVLKGGIDTEKKPIAEKKVENNEVDYKKLYEAEEDLRQAINSARNGDELSQKALMNYIGIKTPKDSEESSHAASFLREPSEDNFNKAIESQVEKAISKLEKRINSTVESVIAPIQQKEADNAIKGMREKHSDFDDYRQEMYQILQRLPEISLDEAYILASAEKTNVKARQSVREENKKSVHEKKQANAVMRQGGKTSNAVQVKPEKFKSFEDAFKYTEGTL